MKQGRIVRVSGPLVVAEGMEEARMFDVVRVSDHRLIGELIELRGDRASIQVYENTGGLGVGEPVVSTGEPLSVELGPGLMGAIYDGIQRPLDAIQAIAGDIITRGIEVPGLNREKKWHFVPKVAVGDKVIGGDVIGEVQETTLVTHRIMVPPNMEGEIIEINEGDYTVEDTVAKIKTADQIPPSPPLQRGELGGTLEKGGTEGIENITMIQRWPVREPRPVKRNLTPRIPLFTGQRVIDALFPVGKGGTACVPGPFGSGKCVTGDTPVLLGNGEIKAIEEIFEQYKNKGQRIVNKNEEYTILDQPLTVFAYQNGRIAHQKVRSLYKGETDRLFVIKTRTGRIAKVTPIHQLFRIDGDLNITETKAVDLKIGDYLISPRVIELPEQMQDIREIGFIGDQERVITQNLFPPLKEVIEELTQKYGTKKALAEELGVSYDVLIGYYLEKNNPTVGFVRKLYSLANYKPPALDKVKGQRQSEKVGIPRFIDKDFAILLGLMLSDGSLKNNSLIFYNNDEEVLNLYKTLINRLFGLKTNRCQMKTVKSEILNNKTVADLLKKLGYPEYKKSQRCSAPPGILTSPIAVISALIGAYFVCDGHFNPQKGEIEITSASLKMASDLTYLCARVGLLARFREKEVGSKNYYQILISGREQIERFYECCNIGHYKKLEKISAYLGNGKRGYSSIDVVPLSSTRVDELYRQGGRPYRTLKDLGIEIHNYIQGELMGKRAFADFAQLIGDEDIKHFALNHLSHIYCDKITDIQEVVTDEPVYDLEVPQGHNFIGGISPMFYHNTVIQHQLAKWADAEIIVYVGCGERGNEMTDVLLEFPELQDPKSGEPLMNRTVLIANTSNMPVAARDASVYTGVTIAEYFRDMGYSVALMADSTSRWAEAMREISGRLEEMPGEEGYPAYLGTRIAEFYERAGRVICLGTDDREGALSIVGAVSPPGGDESDPVVQATLRVVKVFWSLEDKLAYARHFPAISWLNSYSLYTDDLEDYYRDEVGDKWIEMRDRAKAILQEEADLEEIVRLIGMDTLSPENRLIMETAKSIREDFLHQLAFDEIDTYTSFKKQYNMLELIMLLHQRSEEWLKAGKPIDDIMDLDVKEEIARAKYTLEDNLERFEEIKKSIISQTEV